MFWAMYTRFGKCSAAYREIGPICGTYGDTFRAIAESKLSDSTFFSTLRSGPYMNIDGQPMTLTCSSPKPREFR